VINKLWKVGSIVLLPFVLSSCGSGSEEQNEQVNGGGTTDRSSTTLTITAAATQEIQEQTEWSIRADIASTNTEAATTVSWALQNAPDAFTMPLSGGALADGKSTIEFSTPDVDEDTQVVLRISANSPQSASFEAATQTHDITLTIKANQQVVISGAVVDDPIPNAFVNIKVGEQLYEVRADAQGLYTATVEFPEPSTLVEVTALGVPGSDFEAVEFKSYLGSGTSIIEDAGEDGRLTSDENINANISNVTTAVFVLVQDLLQEQSTGVPGDTEVNSQEELDQLIEQVDTQEVIELAAVIQLVVDYGADLPPKTNTVLELAQNLSKNKDAKKDFIDESIEQIVSEDNGIDDLKFDQVKEDIVEDENLVPAPETSKFVNSFYATNSLLGVSTEFNPDELLFGKLTLNNDNSGLVEDFLGSGDQTFTWTVAGTQVVVIFDSPLMIEQKVFDGSEPTSNEVVTGFKINELGSNDLNRSWLMRLTGTATLSGNTESVIESDSLAVTAVTSTQILPFSAGELTGSTLYLTVVDNGAASHYDLEENLFSASTRAVSFVNGGVGSFVNAAGNTVSMSWAVDASGVLTLEVGSSSDTAAHTMRYVKIKDFSKSPAVSVLTQVEYDNESAVFMDISYVKPETPQLNEFVLTSNFKVLGINANVMFLSDNTGFIYEEDEDEPLEFFTYRNNSNGDIEVTISEAGTRECVTTLNNCDVDEVLTFKFDHFEKGRLTAYLDVVDEDEGFKEGITLVAKTVRDKSIRETDVPSNINLYMAETESVHSLFLNSDGTGLFNMGSTDGACTDISWSVNSDSRLEVIQGGQPTVFKVLAGSFEQGVISNETSGEESIFTSTSTVNACTEAQAEFIPLSMSDVEEGAYEVLDLANTDRTVLYFAKSGNGYLVDGDSYYAPNNTQYRLGDAVDFTWIISAENKVAITSPTGNLEFALTDLEFTNGSVQVSVDEDLNGAFEQVLNLPIKLLRNENRDTDGDTLINSFDIDIDGDGTNNEMDAFAFDPTETLDSDYDGIGNNTDTDDDNDDVADDSDIAPTDKRVSEEVTNFTEADLADEYLEIVEGRLLDPAIRIGSTSGAYYRFNTTNDMLSFIGIENYEAPYTISEGKIQVTSERHLGFPNRSPAQLVELGLITQSQADQVESTNNYQVEQVQISQTWRLVLKAKGYQTFEVVTRSRYNIGNASDRLTLTGTEDLVTVEKDEEAFERTLNLVSELEQIPFDASEMMGTWALPVNITVSEDVLPQGEFNFWTDLVTFDSSTATAKLSGRTFNWSIDGEGTLTLSESETGFVSNHKIYNKFNTGYGVHSTAVGTSGSVTQEFSDYTLVVKQQAEANVTPLLGEFAISAFNVTEPSVWGDDAVPDPDQLFGWVLNSIPENQSKGFGRNVYSGSYDFGLNHNGWRERTWSYVDGTEEIAILATNEQSGGAWGNCEISNDDCVAIRERHWIPLANVGNRVYVLEWELENYNSNIFPSESDFYFRFAARVNFYDAVDLSQYYDADSDGVSNDRESDSDNDGVNNDEDLFPLDQNASMDTDGDGIPDSYDNDDDNDGIQDVVDAAPKMADVGSALPFTEDILSDKYLAIEEGALVKPNFRFGRNGDLIEFNKADNTFVYSGFGEYETGTYAFSENVMTLTNDVYESYESIWELANSGHITNEAANAYWSAKGSSDVLIRTTKQESHFVLVAQTETQDIFYIEESDSREIVNDDDRLLLTNGDTTPFESSGTETAKVTRYEDLTPIAFTADEFNGKTWALPANIDGDADTEWNSIKDDLVVFESSTFTNSVSGDSGTWSIDTAGRLVLVLPDTNTDDTTDNNTVTITQFANYDGMIELHAVYQSRGMVSVNGDDVLIEMQFSTYQMGGEVDESASHDVLIDAFSVGGYSLTNKYYYDESDELNMEELGEILRFNADNTVTHHSNGFNVENPNWTTTWSVDGNVFKVTEKYDNSTGESYADCVVDNVTCFENSATYRKPIKTVGNRVYLLEWYTVKRGDSNTSDLLLPVFSFYEVVDFSAYDFDNDGISDNKDTDDDNDGISDEDEIDNGSDPLDPGSFPQGDADNDGVVDLLDAAPMNPEIGAYLQMTSDTLADKYIGIEKGALDNPNFLPLNNGDFIVFNKLESSIVYSGDNDYESSTYALEDDLLVIYENGNSNYDFESMEVSKLVEAGHITQDMADTFTSSMGTNTVNMRKYYGDSRLRLIKQEDDTDTFYIEDDVRLTFENQFDSEVMTGNSFTEFYELDTETAELTRYDSLSAIEFNSSEFESKTWALPVGMGEAFESTWTTNGNDAVTFTSTDFSTQVLGYSGSWSIDSEGQLILNVDNGDTITIKKFEQLDGAIAVHTLFDTQETEVVNNVEESKPVRYSSYQLAGEILPGTSFDHFVNKTLLNSFTLTSLSSYDNEGELIESELFTWYFGDGGKLNRAGDGFMIADSGDTWDWSFNNGAVEMTRTYNLASDNWREECIVDDVNCRILDKRSWKLMSVVGDRAYFIEYWLRNSTAWDSSVTFDPNAYDLGLPGRIVFADAVDLSRFDHDGDGTSDNLDTDDDNDGYLDDDDAFDFDNTEWLDTDGDGVGNNADEDDDGDGVNDDVDVEPLDPEISHARISLTNEILAKTYIYLPNSVIEQPTVDTFQTTMGDTYSFEDAGVFHSYHRNGSTDATWQIDNGIVELDYSRIGMGNAWFSAQQLVDMKIIDSDTRDSFISEHGEVNIQFATETLDGTWSLIANETDEDTFWIKTNLRYQVVDASYGMTLFNDSQYSFEYVDTGFEQTFKNFESLTPLSVDSSSWVGTYALPVWGVDADELGRYDWLVVDMVTLLNDGTGSSDTGATPNFTWSVVNDELLLNFDNGDTAVITKYQQFDTMEEVYAEVTLNGETYTYYSMTVEKASVDFSQFKDKFLLGGFTLVSANSYDENGDIEGEDIFGFRVEHGGVSRTIFDTDTLDLTDDSGNFWYERSWSEVESGVIAQTRFIEQDGNGGWFYTGNCDVTQSSCSVERVRNWTLLAQEADRLYVLEQELRNDAAWQFDNTESYSGRIGSRVQFYTIYDTGINIDTDGDGTFDALDEDDDNDGTNDVGDAFPFDDAETLDSDGDGVGDNADVFPNDNTETHDADGDGIGDNADTDDDNDGVLDVDDEYPNQDSRHVALMTFSDADFATCLANQWGTTPFFNITEVTCDDANITSIEGIEQLINVNVVNLNNSLVDDFSPLAGLPLLSNVQSTKPGFDNGDLAEIASNDNIYNIWLQAPNVTSIEAVRGHPNLRNFHIWGNSPNLEMDVLASLNNIHVLAISADSVDNFSTLGSLSSLEQLWLHHDMDDAEVNQLSGLTNLNYLNIGWGNVSANAVESLVNMLPALTSAELNYLTVDSLAMFFNPNDFQHLTLNNSIVTDLSQIQVLQDAGITVNFVNHNTAMTVNDVIGSHQMFNVEKDDGSFVTVPVIFNSDMTGNLDWGFGNETFTWSLDGEGRVLVDYDAGGENDRWTWYDTIFGSNGFESGNIGVEVDENDDGVFDSHTKSRYHSSKLTTNLVSAHDIVGSHTLVDPNDGNNYTLLLNADMTGTINWDGPDETFTWSLDSEGRLLVDYDDAGNTEIDRWTWTEVTRNSSGLYLSGTVNLEVSNAGDGNFDTLEFTGGSLTKFIP